MSLSVPGFADDPPQAPAPAPAPTSRMARLRALKSAQKPGQQNLTKAIAEKLGTPAASQSQPAAGSGAAAKTTPSPRDMETGASTASRLAPPVAAQQPWRPVMPGPASSAPSSAPVSPAPRERAPPAAGAVGILERKDAEQSDPVMVGPTWWWLSGKVVHGEQAASKLTQQRAAAPSEAMLDFIPPTIATQPFAGLAHVAPAMPEPGAAATTAPLPARVSPPVVSAVALSALRAHAEDVRVLASTRAPSWADTLATPGPMRGSGHIQVTSPASTLLPAPAAPRSPVHTTASLAGRPTPAAADEFTSSDSEAEDAELDTWLCSAASVAPDMPAPVLEPPHGSPSQLRSAKALALLARGCTAQVLACTCSPGVPTAASHSVKTVWDDAHAAAGSGIMTRHIAASHEVQSTVTVSICRWSEADLVVQYAWTGLRAPVLDSRAQAMALMAARAAAGALDAWCVKWTGKAWCGYVCAADIQRVRCPVPTQLHMRALVRRWPSIADPELATPTECIAQLTLTGDPYTMRAIELAAQELAALS